MLVVALLVALPVGWYLGSPIFIRTSLVEAAPAVSSAAVDPGPTPAGAVAVPSVAPSLPSTAAPSTARADPIAATPSSAPFQPAALASGEFVGTDEFHFGRGTATIIEVAPGRYHLRLEDFSVRNGPDLYVYLSPDSDGYTDDALELGTLKATDGSFGYDLPAGTDPAALPERPDLVQAVQPPVRGRAARRVVNGRDRIARKSGLYKVSVIAYHPARKCHGSVRGQNVARRNSDSSHD